MISRRVLCGGLVAAPAVASCRPGQAKMTVILDWLINVNHASLFAAKETGAFARHGLDVELVAPSDPDSPTRLAAAGQADLAVGYGSQINMLADKGLPLVRIGTLINRPMNTVIALGGGAIRTLADLKGRRVGVPVGGVEEAMLYAVLASAGVTQSEITAIRVNYGMVSALLNRRIDASIGAYRNAEVLEVQAKGGHPLVFALEDHGVPPYDELILVGRRDRIAEGRMARFLAALKEGTAALTTQPDVLWRAFVKAYPEQNTPTARAGWPITLGWFARDPAALDRARYEAFQAFCLQRRIIAKSLPLDQFAVQLSP